MRRAFRVGGKVQGVFYRASAADEATRRGLAGWVRNRRDGDVEGVVEGPEPEVEAFLAWCKAGPSRARVDRLDVTEVASDGALTPFRVVADA